MRVFVTGATGFIGLEVVKELIAAGHQVLGLARSAAAVEILQDNGAEAHAGDLTDAASLTTGAVSCDGVVHLGFVHDFSDLAASMRIERLAIEAIGAALSGSHRPFVATTGTMLLSPGRLGTEDDAADPKSAASFRVAAEHAALSWESKAVRVSVVRPAPSVHGPGDTHGFVPMLIKTAREKGSSAYVGDGQNRWPAVHRLDAAHLFKLALEQGTAGARYHAVGDQGIPFRQIAEVIGRRLNLPVQSLPPVEAVGHFGWFASIAGTDNPASSLLTRERLGWQPNHLGLLADLEEPHYFTS